METDNPPFIPFRKKPEWVKQKVLRLKALCPAFGCRKIADLFNRIHQYTRGETVSKTFVSNLIRDHLHEIQVISKKIKHTVPKQVPHNLFWAMDLTTKTDSNGKRITILGIEEHHSRVALVLEPLKNKSSYTILKILLGCTFIYGRPKIIKTDNEAVFTSKLFRSGLFVLRIKHLTSELHCPWQNGRIEKFFGTLKERLNLWEVEGREQLSATLRQFSYWYNYVRPHNNLNGKTPVEVWNGIDVFQNGYKQVVWFEAWDGLLTGYYLRV